MKNFSLIAAFIFFQSVNFTKNKTSHNATTKIEIVASYTFKGDCDTKYCYFSLASGDDVKKINGLQPDENDNIEIYVKCPTGKRIWKGKRYTIVAEDFKANSCVLPRDIILTKNNKVFVAKEVIEIKNLKK